MKKEFSKIILASVMILFFAGAIFAAIVVITEHYGLEALLTYLGAPTATAPWTTTLPTIRGVSPLSGAFEVL